jgi:hypothetical protein
MVVAPWDGWRVFGSVGPTEEEIAGKGEEGEWAGQMWTKVGEPMGP